MRMSTKITWYDQGDDCETTVPYGDPVIILAVQDGTVTYARADGNGGQDL
jgi:hypothetical protein